jgi:putative CRISPR-associated protein (TIGR02619 family)
MATILTTTGISLYLNTKKTQHIDAPTDDQMRQYLRQTPEAASSEAKSLLQMATVNDRLVLLHTQTSEAIRCANLLREFFQDKGYKHASVIQLEFQGDPIHIETTGLRHLINTLIHEIEQAQRKEQQVIINATAGLKAQVVYSTMIGMIYNVPVKYIYEEFQQVVTFNPVALSWNTALFLTYNAFFKWVDDEARTQRQVDNYLKDYDDTEHIKTFLTAPDADNYVYLSYVGNALYRKFRYEVEEAGLIDWPPIVEVQKNEDKIAHSLLHRKHHKIKGSLDACYKIASLPFVQEIIGGHFENTTFTRLKADFDGTIVLLWADNNKAERLTIYTTAKGKPQTLKVAQKIKDVLEIA